MLTNRFGERDPGGSRVEEADLVAGASLQERDARVGQERVLQDRQAGADERHRQLTDAGHFLHHYSERPELLAVAGVKLVDRHQEACAICLKMGCEGPQHVREPPRQVGIGVIGRSQTNARCGQIIDYCIGQMLGVPVQVFADPVG